MRICVTGARGMLGQQLMKTAKSQGFTVIPWTRPEVDITDLASLNRRIDLDAPDAIINCAAWTDVDGAETNHEAAFLANCVGARNVAEASMSVSAKLIHISTDFVYPGDGQTPLVETDATGPKSVYGDSKLVGETAVLELNASATVIRTGYIFGSHGPNLIDKIASGIKSGYQMQFVTDQWMTPTGTPLLADACLNLLQCDAAGIFHVTQGGGCSTYEMASYIADLVTGPGTIVPTTLAEWEPIQSARCQAVGRILAKRPVYSVLNTDKFCAAINTSPVHWKEAIRLHLSS